MELDLEGAREAGRRRKGMEEKSEGGTVKEDSWDGATVVSTNFRSITN